MLTNRHTKSAALAVAILTASACGGGQDEKNANANEANAVTQQAVPQLPIPALEQPLGREQLLLAAEHAASDFAAGVDDAKTQKELADRKFEFRVRFGCDGTSPDGSEAPFDWSVNKETGALKVRATPTLSTKDPAVKTVAGEAFETVEGFWVSQPWMLSTACPRQPASPQETVTNADKSKPTDPTKRKTEAQAEKLPPPKIVGIAQFFSATDPRTLRRSGRAYEATKKLDEGDVPAGGFDLVLTGRLVALPNGRVVACTPSATGERPSCVISVEFGTVSIERADTHEQLAQWGTG